MVIELLHNFGAEAAGEKAGGIAALGIDLKALILQAITFVIIFLLLKKFALDKILATLEERRQKIDEGVDLGLQMELEKQKLEGMIQEQLQKARKEADVIITGAHEEAGSLIKDAETKANHKVESMLADAHAQIAEDVKRAKKELEHEVLELVSEATEAIIGEKLDSKKDSKLIDQALKGVR